MDSPSPVKWLFLGLLLGMFGIPGVAAVMLALSWIAG